MQSALGQNSWKPIQNTNSTQSPQPLLKEYFYTYNFNQGQTNPSSLKSSKLDKIILPNESGEEELFLVKPVQVLSSELAAKYEYIQTYKGYSATRPNVKVRLSTHPTGLNAWVQLPNQGDLFIQPKKNNPFVYFAYQKTLNDKAQEFLCKTLQTNLKRKAPFVDARKSVHSNTKLAIFRIAIATTAEYTSYWGDDNPNNGSNVEDAYGAVVSTLNRINQVFEDELGIRLVLVSDEMLIYEDPDTDPFTGNFSAELQSTIDDVMGDESYDLGHLFDFGEPNGDAGCIGCVCESGAKAKGYSTHPFEDIYGGEYRNDYFDLDYAAHEIGHQFGAFHTFSYNSEGTGVNAEPGSGSTIMGYAGITGPDDIQLHGDPYFHYYSIQNIREALETFECATTETIASQSFSVDAGSDYYIPIGTAYQLSIPELEGERITYCWEQLDSGQITADNFGPYNATGSNARSLPPRVESFRTIPNMKDVLSNNLTQENPEVGDSWETVSLVGRSLQWGLSVRKDLGDVVQLAQDKMNITVVPTATPFSVLSQADSSSLWKGGSYQTVRWEVAQTDLEPIKVEEVQILLSKDGGNQFEYVLSEGTPNDGEATVFVPNSIDTSQARIKVMAKGGIFFAVNQSEFTIESRDIVLNFSLFGQENCDDSNAQFDFVIERKSGFNSPFSIQIIDLPPSVDVFFSKTNYSANDTSGFLILSNLNALPPADYEFNVNAQYGSQSELFSIFLKERESSFELSRLESPADGAENVSVMPTLQWEASGNTDFTKVQIASDSSFQNIVIDTLVKQNTLAVSKLDADSDFFWRIQQQNNCGTSSFSDFNRFQTVSISCLELSSTGIPKTIEDATNNSDGVTTASLNVNFNLPIQDLDVFIDIEHTYLQDLVLFLESPDGKRFLLTSELGDSEDNYTNTIFDQEATTPIFEGTAPFTGRFQPMQSFAQLYGSSPKGIWTLFIEDKYKEDTGRLVDFTLVFCVEGIPLPNSDNDSLVDEQDNCPEITNEDQSDRDNNGIGDVCDIFSAQNLTITKKDTSCPNKSNGNMMFSALADYLYRAEVVGNNGYRKTITFTTQGNTLSNLPTGVYSICITSVSFSDFEYCFETEIMAPAPLEVVSSLSIQNTILNLSLAGADKYWITVNDQIFEVSEKKEIAFPLTQKLNRVMVQTSNSCQGVFEQWINTNQTATVFPNPIEENANLILPDGVNANIILLSSAGAPLWQKLNVQSNGETIQIPMSGFYSGFYLLKLVYPEGVQTLKLLKK